MGFFLPDFVPFGCKHSSRVGWGLVRLVFPVDFSSLPSTWLLKYGSIGTYVDGQEEVSLEKSVTMWGHFHPNAVKLQ